MYFANIIQDVGRVRKCTQYRYSVKKSNIVDTVISYYKIYKFGLKKMRNRNDSIGVWYFSIKSDSCIVYKHSDPIMNNVLSTRHCFIGEKNVKNFSNNDSTKQYVFTKEVGQHEKVISEIYYDESFVLQEEIYLEGFYPNYKKILVDRVPEKFKKLLEQ